MTTTEFIDGLAFYRGNREIAFYNNMIDAITFTIPPNCINCVEITLEDLEEIRIRVNLYKGTEGKGYD